jgi:hypothetical protein
VHQSLIDVGGRSGAISIQKHSIARQVAFAFAALFFIIENQKDICRS